VITKILPCSIMRSVLTSNTHLSTEIPVFTIFTPAFVRAWQADSNAALPLTASMDSRAGLDALETPDAGECRSSGTEPHMPEFPILFRLSFPGRSQFGMR
jgi:hypothetical protein